MSQKILLTGGGTAGHVTPNIALIPRLQEAGYQVEYVGSEKGIEGELVRSLDIPFHAVSSGKFRRYFDWQNVTDVLRVLLGFLQALQVISRVRPDILFSKGGFVASPVVWASWLLRVPVVIHESDMKPGLANRLSLPFAKKVCYSFPESKSYLPVAKAIYTGVPVRDELLKGDRNRGQELLAFRETKPVLLVVGGSLGSEVINRSVRNSLEALLELFNVVHICGAGRIRDTLISYEGYRQFEYVGEQLKHIFAMTDLVISRAGATMLFELLALHKPSLLIPLSLKVSRGDQIDNACSFKSCGYSEVLQEEELNKKALLRAVKGLYENRADYVSRLSRADEKHALHRVLSVIHAQARK